MWRFRMRRLPDQDRAPWKVFRALHCLDSAPNCSLLKVLNLGMCVQLMNGSLPLIFVQAKNWREVEAAQISAAEEANEGAPRIPLGTGTTQAS